MHATSAELSRYELDPPDDKTQKHHGEPVDAIAARGPAPRPASRVAIGRRSKIYRRVGDSSRALVAREGRQVRRCAWRGSRCASQVPSEERHRALPVVALGILVEEVAVTTAFDQTQLRLDADLGEALVHEARVLHRHVVVLR